MENGKLPIVLPSLYAVAAEAVFAESLLGLYDCPSWLIRPFFPLVKCEISLILNPAFAMHPEEHQIEFRKGKNSAIQSFKHRTSMKSNNRLVYLLQEIGIVVVGVLIAVSINNYKEKSDNEAYIEKTLLAIDNEINSNKTALDSVLNRHIEIYDFFERDSMDKEQPLGEILYSLGGFQIATVKNISLRFFVANKAELLDFELISYLLEIEQITNILSAKIDRLANFAYEHVNDSGEDARVRFTYLLMDIIDSERNLQRAYTDFLERHEAYLERKGK